jgi:two-component system, NtrC family, nitrogen regulation response regulator GlnG
MPREGDFVIADDPSTLTLGPLDSLAGSRRRQPLVPALTIVWHPDFRRVGEIAPLAALLKQDVAVLKRDEPVFLPPGSSAGKPIGHRGMSRDVVIEVAQAREKFELRRGAAATEVELDGVLFEASRLLDPADLSRGLLITIARRFVLFLHAVRFPVTRSPDLGLIGTSDAMESIRRTITRVADLPTAILIRGESGTGKELVAKALHKTSRRSAGPFVDVNMAVLRPERAAAELFGYEKGAFTGAGESRPGFFRAANSGTLFLDEIGFTPLDVQPMLLRVLEDGRVQPLGGAQPRKVDVRLVAATDARLEEAVAAARFHGSLYFRLGTNIAIPPLRERREDIGPLFVHFLVSALTETGESRRLEEPDDGTRPWITARTAAAVASASWLGNVRALKALAQELAFKSAQDPRADATEIVNAFLARQPTTENSEPTATAEEPDVRSSELSNERILDALEAAGWNRAEAARRLKISRTTLWRRIATEPELQAVTEIKIADLLRQKEACGGDVTALARKLGVSTALLERRLRNPP